jgi:hypothetical protein
MRVKMVQKTGGSKVVEKNSDKKTAKKSSKKSKPKGVENVS